MNPNIDNNKQDKKRITIDKKRLVQVLIFLSSVPAVIVAVLFAIKYVVPFLYLSFIQVIVDGIVTVKFNSTEVIFSNGQKIVNEEGVNYPFAKVGFCLIWYCIFPFVIAPCMFVVSYMVFRIFGYDAFDHFSDRAKFIGDDIDAKSISSIGGTITRNDNNQDVDYFLAILKSSSETKEKLRVLNYIQDAAYERLTYNKLSVEDIAVANSLLECLVNEWSVMVLCEVLDTLVILTDCAFIPLAKWDILVLELSRFQSEFKNDWLLEQSIILIGRSCHVNYIDLVRPFCASKNPRLVKVANEAIMELNYNMR
jgi:hypothetical protein